MHQQQRAGSAESGRIVERIDPSRASAGYVRWRRALAEALGADPGARLDYPAYRLTLYKIFGATRRLAELCLKHPTAAADAILEGPSFVLADCARDLAPLAASGAGAPDQLYAALAPIKNRADIAIAIAEISGAWRAREATAARADLAERMIETALAWLLRAGLNRGELAAGVDDPSTSGVFALAGGDFSHLDLAPYGPLQLVVVYDEKNSGARLAERAFVRLGAELKEAFEGRTGDHPIFALKTVFGSGVNGAGLVDCRGRLTSAISAETAAPLRAWIATARTVAGDRAAGGQFLESLDQILWAGASRRPTLEPLGEDPRAPFRQIADVFRRAFGAGRPIFRAASGRDVMEAAAKAGALSGPIAERLVAGEEFVHAAVSLAQAMKGGAATYAAADADEARALAVLCGFSQVEDFDAALGGAVADARNTLRVLTSSPLSEFERFRAQGERPDDIDKLEDLGFADGAGLSDTIGGWTKSAEAPTRFAALAPGLLTAFGETQRPDAAIRLFDDLLKARGASSSGVPDVFKEEGRPRDGVVAAFGCFSDAVAPLIAGEPAGEDIVTPRGAETPRDAREWLSRFPAPRSGAPADEIGAWRREAIARVALFTAGGDLSFDAAAQILEATAETALARLFASCRSDDKSADGTALYVIDGPSRGLPGAPAVFGFIKTNKAVGGEAERLAKAVVSSLDAMGAGYFALPADVSHRPDGAAGPLAPDAAQFKTYIQSGAIAQEQILFARARVIAGSTAAQEAAKSALRSSVMNPRRADTLFREVDRARAQRLRRDRAGADWDLEHLEGGPLDVDLLISTLIYRHAAAQPAIQQGNVDAALDLLAKAGLVAPHAADTLKSARQFYARLGVVRALARWSAPQTEPARPRFAALLAEAAGVKRVQEIRALTRGHAEEVTRLYAQLVLGRPAQALAVGA